MRKLGILVPVEFLSNYSWLWDVCWCNFFNFKVPLQNVLNHNTARIFEDQDIVEHIERLAEANGGELEITNFVKIGFDGTDLGDKDKIVSLSIVEKIDKKSAKIRLYYFFKR